MLAIRSAGAAMSFRERLSCTGVRGAREEVARVGFAGQKHRLALTGEHGLYAAARLRNGVAVAAGCDHGDAVAGRGEPLDQGLYWRFTPEGRVHRNGVRIPELVAHTIHATPRRSGAAAGRRRVGRRRTRRRPTRPAHLFRRGLSLAQPWQTAVAP